MGNEFGHPEWIDFPREGNVWSYKYARRQWHLVDDTTLKYHFLAQFDRDMIDMAKRFKILDYSALNLLHEHSIDKVIIFERGGLIFAFNFHPGYSHSDYRFDAPPGKYRMVLDSDASKYGGHARLSPDQYHQTICEKPKDNNRHFLNIYLPARTAQILAPVS